MYKLFVLLMTLSSYSISAEWHAKIVHDSMNDSKKGWVQYWAGDKQSVQISCDELGWDKELSLFIVFKKYIDSDGLSRLDLRFDKEKMFTVRAKTYKKELYIKDNKKIIDLMKQKKQLRLRTYDYEGRRHMFSVSLMGFTKALNDACGWWLNDTGEGEGASNS